MNAWDEYPADYRQKEIEFLRQAICAGESAALIGLSGSGKSNLLGFMAARMELPAICPRLVLVDCNLMAGLQPEHFFSLAAMQLGGNDGRVLEAMPGAALSRLEGSLEAALTAANKVCLMVDRFDILMEQEWFTRLSNNLRALRDRFKYRLAYLVAARRSLDHAQEMAELFFGRTLWLAPLSEQDALWSAERDIQRYSAGRLPVDAADLQRILQLSGGYPSLLRAICEAWVAGVPLKEEPLRRSPSVAKRLAEFWQDRPDREALKQSGLADHPWLGTEPKELRVDNNNYPQKFDPSLLTAKENLLLRYLMSNPERVCEKDELVQAVWPEEVQFSHGVRDESLAQLVHRLRMKVEAQPEEPIHILTAPGRGYIYRR